MQKPTSSHLPGLEYALTLLGEEGNLQAYTAKLSAATIIAQAAVARETRVEAPLDYVPPVVPANPVTPDDQPDRPRDYVVQAPGTIQLTASVTIQSQVMTTLAGICLGILTVHKLFTEQLSTSYLVWHVLGAGFFGLCAFYFPIKSFRAWRAKHKKSHDEASKK
jgi:hypothetical protein